MSDPYKTPESETFDPNSELEGAMQSYQFWKQFARFLKVFLLIGIIILVLFAYKNGGGFSYEEDPTQVAVDTVDVLTQISLIFIPLFGLLAFLYYKMFTWRLKIRAIKKEIDKTNQTPS